MKEKWEQLQPNERLTVVIGAIALVLILGYFSFYRPLQLGIEKLETENSDQQALLSWMEPAAKRISILRTLQTTKTESKLALLPLLEESLKSTDLNKQASEISQTEGNKVRIKFKQVSFDQLITWLSELWKKYGIEVTDMTVVPKKPTGFVEATVILSKAENKPS